MDGSTWDLKSGLTPKELEQAEKRRSQHNDPEYWQLKPASYAQDYTVKLTLDITRTNWEQTTRIALENTKTEAQIVNEALKLYITILNQLDTQHF